MPLNNKSRKPRRSAYKPNNKGPVSNAVKKYVKKVTSRTRPEMKSAQANFVESTLLNTSAIGTSFRATEFPSMTQGTTRETRIGNEIYLHGFHSKGSYFNTGSAVVYIRRLVLGTTTGVDPFDAVNSELFDTAAGQGQSLTQIGNNMGLIQSRINTNQFKVYFDKTIKLSPSTATDGTQTKLYNHFQKFGGKKIKFDAQTVGLNSQNARMIELYLVAQADNDAVTGITVEQSENYTTYFTDP